MLIPQELQLSRKSMEDSQYVYLAASGFFVRLFPKGNDPFHLPLYSTFVILLNEVPYAND